MRSISRKNCDASDWYGMDGGAWIVISAKVIHGPSWSFWEHAILGERNETDVAGLDGLTYIEFYHRHSDLFV